MTTTEAETVRVEQQTAYVLSTVLDAIAAGHQTNPDPVNDVFDQWGAEDDALRTVRQALANVDFDDPPVAVDLEAVLVVRALLACHARCVRNALEALNDDVLSHYRAYR
jgi:hypothetical protein